MEILSTDTYTSLGDFGLIVGLIGIGFIAFGFVLALEAFSEGKLFMISVGIVLIAVGILTIHLLKDIDGTEYIEHQVVITDIDMVVEGGYEIVDMEGKLATIRKELEVDK